MITIYRTPNCPRCKLLAAAFQKAGIDADEKPLDAYAISEYTSARDKFVASAPIVLVKKLIESENLSYDEMNWFGPDDLFDANGNLLVNWRQVLEGIKPHKAEFTGKATNEAKVQACKSIWGE